MPAVINTNIASLNSQRNLNSSQSALQVSLQRLSSGLRINSAKDDAAGLAISERFSTQIRGLNQAARNANDGISLAQTGEGALAAVTDNLQRIRELAVQAANSTNSADDRAAINLEVQQRLAEIDRTASQTSFNGQKLLDGSFANANFQIGANAGETISVDLASSNVRNTNIGAVATATSAVLGAGATGGSAITGAITAGDFSDVTTPATSGTLTLNPATRNFGTAAVPFVAGASDAKTVARTDFSEAGTPLTSGSVSFTATDSNFQALVAGKSDPMTVTSFDNDGTSALVAGYNSQVPTDLTYSGAGLAQFNVTDGTNTASITLTTDFTEMTALATELQTQLQLGGGDLATSTVSYDAGTGGLLLTNAGVVTALQVANSDANALAAGFVNSAGVAGAAANSVAEFSVAGTVMTMASGGTTITDFAADLNTQIQASLLADKVNYLAEVVDGKIVITHAGSTTAVAIAGPNAKALASGIVASAGVAGTAASDPSTLTIGGNVVTLDQNYLSYDNMAADIGVQLGANFTVANTAGAFTITRVDAGGAGSTAIDITGDAASDTAGITAAGVRAGTAGTDLVAAETAIFDVGTTTVTLNTNLTDRAGVLLELQSQLAGYNVTDDGTDYTFTSLTDSAAVAITNASAGAISAGFTETAGVEGDAVVNTTNATFTMDGQDITLNADYATFDAMATGLQGKLDTAFGANIYTVTNNAGALTIAKVADGAASTAPDITVADANSEAAGLGIASGTSVGGLDEVVGTNVDLTIDGEAISLAGNNSTLTDVVGDLQSALDTAFAANAYTVSVSGTGLKVLNNTMGSAAVSIATGNAAATTAGFGTIASTAAGVAGGSVTLGDLSINGTSLVGTYASTDALATEINNTVSGVYATVSGGALTLNSGADIVLAGAADTAAMTLTAGTVAANSGSLSVAAVDTVANANMTIQRIDSALGTVSTLRSTFGAIQNRFESVISSLTATSENLTAARSRIQDTDFAAETAQLTRNQILQQAGTAMLAQANQLPNTVLSLLR